MIGRAHRALGAAVLIALSAPATAAPPESLAALRGTWHVLIHYRDADAHDPEQWRWEDRVWEIRTDGDRLVFAEYLLIQFVDESGRFVHLRTPLAARVPGAWEPNERQALQIESGLRVLERSVRRVRLARSGEEWRSHDPRPLSRLVGDAVYSSDWSLAMGPDGPVLTQRDRLHSRAASEELGTTRYEVQSVSEGILSGRYDHDGRRIGRFRLSPTQIAGGAAREADADGRLPMIPQQVRLRADADLLLAFVRPIHSFGERTLRIETTPADAELDLAYLRRGTQLLAARTGAPVTVLLPSRVRAGAQDALRINVRAAGHEREWLVVPVRSSRSEVHVELSLLPNQLVAGWARSLAGRGSVTLVTTEAPILSTRRAPDEYTLVLARTALAETEPPPLAHLRADALGEVSAIQAGDDLVLQIEFRDATARRGVQVRESSAEDPVRDEYLTRLDWSLDEDDTWATRVSAALAALERRPGASCARAFEDSLRIDLGGGLLPPSAVAPGFLRPVYRGALRRHGELSADRGVRLRDGGRLDASDPLELDLALTEPALVIGYAATLRDLVAALEPSGSRRHAARGLLAPGVGVDAFGAALTRAETAERLCTAELARAGGASPYPLD